MDGKIKAALVVGLAVLVLNLGSGMLCQLCPLTLSLIAGALAGWLAVLWGSAEVEAGQPATAGAIAGILVGIAGFGGQILSVIGNMSFFAATGFVNPLTGEPMVGPERTAGIIGALGIWGCAGVVVVALTVGVAALAARLAADRRAVPPAPADF